MDGRKEGWQEGEKEKEWKLLDGEEVDGRVWYVMADVPSL